MCTNFEIPKRSDLEALDKQMKELVEQRKKQLELEVEVQKPLTAEEKLEDWMTKNKQTTKEQK